MTYIAPIEWLNISRAAAALITAFVICLTLIPRVNYIARKKGLLNRPDTRTSHRYATPNFGGVSVFLGFILSALLFIDGDALTIQNLKYLVFSLLLMFFVGFKDDIMEMSAEKKLMAQLLVAVLLVVGGIQITSLHGLFNVGEVNEIVGAILTVIFIVMVINAVNLMDGIDGYAALYGIITLFPLGFWFYMNGIMDWSVICFALMGALIAFFFYNVYGLRNKTFLGDSGSMLLGLALAAIIVAFSEANLLPNLRYHFLSAPAVAISFILLPVVDVGRVFFIRIVEGKSPFYPDRNHFHHRLIDMGFSHLQASALLSGVSLVFIAAGVLMNSIGILRLGAILIALLVAFIFILEWRYSKTRRTK